MNAARSRSSSAPRTASPAFLLAALLSWPAGTGVAQEAAVKAAAPRVEVTVLADRVRIEIDGRLFTEYRFQGFSRPILYPVLGPSGTRLTRRWPIEDAGEHEVRDHPHHKSLWFAHGDVNGHDFWSESAGAGRIVHDRLFEARSGDVGVIRARNLWKAADGETVCTEERTLRARADGGARVLDFAVTLRATEGELVFGDTKEGTMALRLHPALRLIGEVAEGEAVSSTGVRGRRVWGRRAAWIDYYGPIGGKVVGAAILDHPGNLRHPTWWHARHYGLFAANPFGIHDFEGKPPGTGDHVVAAGGALTLRYRLVFHEGDAERARIAERFAAWAGEREGEKAPADK